MNILEIRHLKKRFGDVRAVDGIDFSVREGELFAFLGLNGAGKSTTIAILCGTLARDSGEVRIDGESIDTAGERIKRELGIVFQQSVLDKPLSVYENLRARAALYGLFDRDFEERLVELSDLLELRPLLKKRVGKLSGGQRRRVDIARAILHRPRLLILDEPTTGLDPQTRRRAWEVIEDLRRKEGMTVFLTTHYMEEAVGADHVVILDSGRIVAEGTPHELKDRYASDSLSLYGITKEQAEALGLPMTALVGGYRFALDSTASVPALIAKHPTLFTDFEVTKGNMDDVFLAVTGKRPEEGGAAQ